MSPQAITCTVSCSRDGSLERLQFALDATDVAVYELDLARGPVYLNDTGYRLLGYQPGEIHLDHDVWQALLHPDDLQRMNEELLDWRKGRIDTVSIEVRAQCKDGRYKWFHQRVWAAERDAHGEPSRWIGTAIDIDARKRQEDAIHRLMDATATAFGMELLHALARELASVLEIRDVAVAEVLDASLQRFRAVAVWSDGRKLDPFEYDAAGTPCEQIFKIDRCFYTDNVQAHFPDDHALRVYGVQSYWGIPLRDTAHRPIGHLFLMDNKAMSLPSWIEPVVRVYAARAGAELERLRYEATLRYRIGMEELIADISARFINLPSSQMDSEITLSLERVGKFVGGDRSFVFLLSEDGLMLNRVHRWEAAHVHQSMHEVQAIPVADFEWTFARLAQLESVSVARVTALPPDAARDRNSMLALGIQSLLAVPLTCTQRLIGCLGFNTEREKEWSSEDATLLRVLGEIFVNAFERRRAEADLHTAKEAAEAANRAKSEFLASMSHELRTPLNAILGYAQILQRDRTLGAAQIKGIDVIHTSGEHLLTLINDILDLSKIEARKLDIIDSEFSLSDFVRNVSDVARMRAHSKLLAFSAEVEDGLPARVRGDEKRLRQVLINLLDNAVKFTAQGEVRLWVARDSGHGLRFEVSDTGIGIAPEHLPEIYLPFHQVGDPRNHGGGVGLGLAICKRLVDLMGGDIRVESAPGCGTTFSALLNLPAAEDSPSVARDALRPVTGYDGARRRVLIVDNAPDNLAMLAGLLVPIGFEVAQLGDGEGVLTAAARFEPHAILIDVATPVHEGLATTRLLRAATPPLRPAIIALSANAFSEHRSQCLEAGCDDFIAKPVNFDALLGRLQHHLQLTWQYQEVQVKTSRDPQISHVARPSPECLCDLQALAQRGDVQGLRKRLEQIERNEKHAGFAARLRALADNFDFKAIRNLLRQCSERPE
ncbi:MAG: PAS domain-containing protein [Gammaproteobacteria bacterium]|nr:PAS domain-containing protein [Gammaproteobacteria bacterium]